MLCIAILMTQYYEWTLNVPIALLLLVLYAYFIIQFVLQYLAFYLSDC